MKPVAEQLAQDVQPYGERCTVLDTPVDEEQRASGLVLPIHSGDACKRGVVTAVGWAGDEVQVGTVVWYCEGWQIGDVTVVERHNIVAYAHED